MLHVTCSNSLERLVARADALLGGDPLGWALEGRTVFVPDRVSGGFLLDGLARARGVCAGVATPGHAALGERVAALVGRTLLDAPTVRALLLELLLDPAVLAADALAPVRAYLAGAPDPALWALQLAERLAALFLERARRPAAVAASLPSAAETLRWQEALHARIFGPEGALARLEAAGEGTYRTLAALAGELDPGALALPPELTPLLVLATRTLEPDLRALLVRLGEAHEVHLLRFSPGPADPALGAAQAHPLLAAWGRPGLGEGATLSAAARARPALIEVRRELVRPGGQDRLARLQRALVGGAAEREHAGAPATLSARAFSSRRAEVEGAAWTLLERLREDEAAGGARAVQLHELALLAPGGLGPYRPLIASICEAAGLPVAFLEGAPATGALEAVERLLVLFAGRRARGELQGALTHPLVLAGSGLEREQVTAWLDELEVALGFDRADQAETYLTAAPAPSFHLASALTRLALGAFALGERSGETRAVALAEGPLAPHELDPEERAAAARFMLLARSLAADARASERPRPLAEWGPWLAAALTAPLGARDEDEAQLVGRIRARLARLGERERCGRAVPLSVAAALAREALADLAQGRRQHLAGGVIAASRLPPLPWRHVVVLGLDEDWPGRDPEDGLDLAPDPAEDPAALTPSRRALEALLATLAAAERVELGWVDRDARGEARAPSPALADLGRLLREEGLIAPGEPWCRRADGAAPALELPGARAEARARACARELAGALGPGASVPPLEALRPALHPEARATLDALSGLLGLDPAPAPAAASTAAPLEVSLAELRRFLRSPLQETARRRGLPEPASEGRGDAEPFALAPRARTALLRATFVAAWAGDGVLSERLAAEHEAALARLEAAGRLPVGPFRDVEVRRQAETLRHWLHGLLAALGAERRQRLVRVRLGGVLGEEAGDALCEQLLPALELELPGEVPTRARLGGRLALLFEDRRASVTLCTSARLRPEDLVLDGFLAHVVLAAADPGGVPARRALRVVPERRARPVRPVELAPLDSARARAYLAALVSDLLAGASCLFPLEAALAYQLEQARGAGSSRPLVERIRWLRDGPRPRGGFASGPLTRLGELPLPPSEDEALALLERRLGLLRALRGTP